VADAKRIAWQILRAIGKGFYYLGKGIWLLAKGIGKGIGILYREYQERRRIEAIRREHYRGIERENFHAGRGWAKGVAEVNENERLKRQNERDHREQMKRLNKMFEPPKMNNNFFVQDIEPKKKKKKRSILDMI